MKLSSPALKNSRASSGLVWGVWGPAKIPPGFPGFCIVAKLVPWLVGGLCCGLFGTSNPNNIGSFCRVGRKLKNFGEISWGAGRLSWGTFPLIASRCLNRCFSGITRDEKVISIQSLQSNYGLWRLTKRESWFTVDVIARSDMVGIHTWVSRLLVLQSLGLGELEDLLTCSWNIKSTGEQPGSPHFYPGIEEDCSGHHREADF